MHTAITSAVNTGEIYIDDDGKIWRRFVDVGGQGKRTKHFEEPVRAENIITNKTGKKYMQVQVWENGKRYVCMAHRLVWAWHNNTPPDGMVVHHIDEDTLNNHPSNLMAMTYSEHNKHHPHTPWNKGKSGGEWHAKTVAARYKNYIERAKESYELCKHLKIRDVAFLRGVSERTVSQQVHDYKREVMQYSD